MQCIWLVFLSRLLHHRTLWRDLRLSLTISSKYPAANSALVYRTVVQNGSVAPRWYGTGLLWPKQLVLPWNWVLHFDQQNTFKQLKRRRHCFQLGFHFGDGNPQMITHFPPAERPPDPFFSALSKLRAPSIPIIVHRICGIHKLCCLNVTNCEIYKLCIS